MSSLKSMCTEPVLTSVHDILIHDQGSLSVDSDAPIVLFCTSALRDSVDEDYPTAHKTFTTRLQR